MLLVGFFAQARTECAVIGQDPSNPSNYNQLLMVIGDAQLEFNKSKFIYQTNSIAVTAAKTKEGKLAVSLIIMPASVISSVATGGSDFVSLIDASNKMAIICTEKNKE